ncbi:MAG: T9SS type A sorting domain-containing protein [Bacteroidia bacterium]|nr:T9SS type A sorting domain-containing protein [Bacteroidia bacterium]
MKKSLLVLMVLMSGWTASFAQVSTYTFAQSSGTYTPVSGGAVLGTPTNDDTSFPDLPIGFTFWYNGAPYTRFSVNSNGFIAMGTSVASSYTAISTGSTNNVIAGCNFDIQGEATIGDLQYITTGTSPNRTLVVQWTNFDKFSSSSNTGNMNFQIRLSEADYSVQVVYGAQTATTAAYTAQVGLRGNASSDYNNRSVPSATSWASSTAGVSNAATCAWEAGTLPASGLTYTWTPPPAPAAPVTLTFSAIGVTAMTLNWLDNSTNEGSFVVLRSTDNINFTAVGTVTSTTSLTTGTPYSSIQTGLSSNTLYYWRVVSVGMTPSVPLSGQQATNAGTMCGTMTVGPTGTYTSLTAAFAAVATNGVSCPVIFELQPAYVSTVETFPLAIGFMGLSPVNTVTVRPQSGATNLSITSSSAQTLNFNGATNVIFDGRPGGVGTTSQLTIANTATTGAAVQMIGDADGNGFNYCTLQGVNTSTVQGVVLLGNSTSVNGNKNHFFQNCSFIPGASSPCNMIYATNTLANSFTENITINNCTFRDWFLATGASNAIMTSTSGVRNWTVTNNQFYQTATRTYTTAANHSAISLQSTSAGSGGHTVTGNFIGGTAPNCGGTAYTMTGTIATRFYGVFVNGNGGTANTVSNNTIQNFNLTTSSGATTTFGVWCGVYSLGTNVNTTISGNVIGSTTAANSVVTTVTTTGGMTAGIYGASSGTYTVTNNQIGGITANGSTSTISTSVNAILLGSTASPNVTITGNTVGSLTVPNSIINQLSTGTTNGTIRGIQTSANPVAIVSNNTIQNVTNQFSGTATAFSVYGIVSGALVNTVNNNTVRNVSTLSPTTGTLGNPSIMSIGVTSTGDNVTHTIEGNTVESVANLSTTTNASHVYGIYYAYTGAANPILTVANIRRNRIAFIGSPANTGAAAVTNGILLQAGPTNVSNNMVILGVDNLGNPGTATNVVNGIMKTAPHNANIYYNTVNITGSGVGTGVANTAALNRTGLATDDVRGNVFVNTRSNASTGGTHYIFNYAATSTITQDNNICYSTGTGTATGIVGATPYANMGAWIAGTSLDANTIATNPNFISNTDVHINNTLTSVLESRAPVLGGIVVDFDNQVRPGGGGTSNGGGTIPDIGADEFDGIPVSTDVGAFALVTPTTSGCKSASETIRVRVKNFSTQTLNLATTNVTVNLSVTGANPQSYPSILLNTGTIVGGGVLDTTFTTTYNMTAPGTHTFNASTTCASDFVVGNDAITVNINISGGTVTGPTAQVCQGQTGNFSVAGFTNGGTIQWQSSPDNVTFTNIPLANASTYTASANDTTFYRAEICGTYYSTSDTLKVNVVSPPVVTHDTICGSGQVTLGATGSGTVRWFNQPTGGTQVNTGSTYTPTVNDTTAFYVENSSGTPPSQYLVTMAAGNGSSANCFAVTAINTITITQFSQNVSSTANTPVTFQVWYRPDNYHLVPGSQSSNTGWTQLGQATTNSMGSGVPTVIPITFSVTIPAGQTYSFQVGCTSGSVNYTNGTTTGAVFNSNADLSVTQGHGGTFFGGMVNTPRVFNGYIYYSAGCSSAPRVPVYAVVTPADSISFTADYTTLCTGMQSYITVSSNAGYDYTWTDVNGYVAPLVGSEVFFTPTANGNYNVIVNGNDPVTGCNTNDTLVISMNPRPTAIAVVDNDTICAGTPIQFNVEIDNDSMDVGTGVITNTSTTYPAPYGHFYWGAKHQMLITAAELTAAGFSAGQDLTGMAFFVTNTNGTAALVNYEVKLGHTAATALTTTFLNPTMTSVFSTPSYAPVVGANVHTFTAPFAWNGSSNLLVETCFNNTGSFTSNCSMLQTATAFASSSWLNQDAAGVCAALSGFSTANQRPNMRFYAIANPLDYAYNWTPASVSSTTIANPTAAPTASGDYTVEVSYVSTGCEINDTLAIMVNPLPPVDLGADATFCTATGTTLSAPAGAYSYLWNDNSTNQTLAVSASGTYDVLVTDSLTTCTDRDTVVLTQVDMGVTASANTPLCTGFTLNLNASNVSSATYAWTGPNAYTASGATPSISNAQPTNNGTYNVTATSTVNAACTATGSVNVTVQPITLVVNPDLVDSTLAHTIITNCQPNYTLYWRRIVTNSTWSSMNIPGNTPDITGLLPATAYMAYVVDANGATSPLVYFITGGTPFCGPAPTPISATVNCDKIFVNWASGYGQYATYFRKITPTLGATGASYTASTSAVYTITPANFGSTYEVSVFGMCDNQYSQAAPPVYVTVPDPRPAQPTGLTFSATCNSITTNWSAVPNAVGYFVRIKNGASTTANVYTTSTSYTRTGLASNFTYTVFVTPVGCSNLQGTPSLQYFVTTCTGTVVPTGIRAEAPDEYADMNEQIDTDMTSDFMISVYPNPNNGSFNVSLNEVSGETALVEVVNMMGQVVYSQNVATESASINHEVILDKEVAAGTYMVRITTVNGTKLAKMIKQ